MLVKVQGAEAPLQLGEDIGFGHLPQLPERGFRNTEGEELLLLPPDHVAQGGQGRRVQGQGDARWLERQLRGLVWLRDSGLLWWDILILDLGLEQDALLSAQRLAERLDNVVLMNLDEVKEWMEQHDGQ